MSDMRKLINLVESLQEGKLSIYQAIDQVTEQFNAQFKDELRGPVMDSKGPGLRVWTRGDGTRHRDPASIYFFEWLWSPSKQDSPAEKADILKRGKKAEKYSHQFWPWLKSQPGAKPAGTISGEFGSSDFTEAVSYLGHLWVKRRDNYVEVMSRSRVKNPNAVWRQK